MNFIKSNFSFDGSSKEVYVNYEGRFIARFKYKAPKANANKFIKFLIENFSVNEYFSEVDKGIPPMKILNAKGFVSYNTAKILQKNG